VTRRARYTGPYEKVDIFDSNAEEGVYAPKLATVERGHLLPADVPARIRDELLAGEDWSEVEQSSGKDDEKKGDG
jgi:hypothetical protein